MQISIIIPVYNVEKYLRQCVDSVLAQTYTDWELILVDDGSPDSCPEICDYYASKDSRIRVIHQPNGGLSRARNAGIKESKGEYITFIDSDDYVRPEYLEVLYKKLTEEKSDISCVNFSYDTFKLGSGNLGTHVLSGWEFGIKLLYQKYKYCTHSSCGKLYKKSIFEDNLFTPDLGYEDLDIFYRIYPKIKRIVHCEQSLYFYRPNPNSYLHKFTQKRSDVLDITDRIVECYGFIRRNKFGKKLLKAARDRRLSAHFNIFGLMAANNYKDKTLEDRCWSVIRAERFSSLMNPEVRLKNKLGALLSYLGKPTIRLLSKFIYNS